MPRWVATILMPSWRARSMNGLPVARAVQPAPRRRRRVCLPRDDREVARVLGHGVQLDLAFVGPDVGVNHETRRAVEAVDDFLDLGARLDRRPVHGARGGVARKARDVRVAVDEDAGQVGGRAHVGRVLGAGRRGPGRRGDRRVRLHVEDELLARHRRVGRVGVVERLLLDVVAGVHRGLGGVVGADVRRNVVARVLREAGVAGRGAARAAAVGLVHHVERAEHAGRALAELASGHPEALRLLVDQLSVQLRRQAVAVVDRPGLELAVRHRVKRDRRARFRFAVGLLHRAPP